jgi:hypothetical protein
MCLGWFDLYPEIHGGEVGGVDRVMPSLRICGDVRAYVIAIPIAVFGGLDEMDTGNKRPNAIYLNRKSLKWANFKQMRNTDNWLVHTTFLDCLCDQGEQILGDWWQLRRVKGFPRWKTLHTTDFSKKTVPSR